MLGLTSQEAGAQEVLEATGVVIAPETLRVVTVETTPDRQAKPAFCPSLPLEHDSPFVRDGEVSEVRVIYEPVETAFPLHIRIVREFFERENLLPAS
jgi:hypothetical protein